MKRRTLYLSASWAGAILFDASAALSAPNTAASVRIVESMAVGALSPVRVGPNSQIAARFGSSIPASTIIGISGRPNQAYSIRLQSNAGRTVVNFKNITAWSDNASGNIASGYSTRMNDHGRDVLRLNGDLSVTATGTDPGTIASMSLGIDYQ